MGQLNRKHSNPEELQESSRNPNKTPNHSFSKCVIAKATQKDSKKKKPNTLPHVHNLSLEYFNGFPFGNAQGPCMFAFHTHLRNRVL